MSAHVHSGTVYFAAIGDHVKIGYSSGNLQKRLDYFRHRRPGVVYPVDLSATAPLVLLRTIPGCIMRDEHRLHLLFDAHHAVGEWFHLTDEFREKLAGLEFVTDREILADFRRVRRELKKSPADFFADSERAA